jgi:hypothetical protein
MNALRRIALILCLAPLCYFGAVAQAAQPEGQAQAAQSKPAQKAAAKPAPKQVVKKASNSKAKPASKPVSKAVATPLPKPKLDLSLPAELVGGLKPDVGSAASIQRRAPLLPAMFTEKPQVSDSPFQLNGRLISNEMQLQLRNDSRHDVEGAVIDFEFRQ